MKNKCDERMKGRVCLISGATSGVGRAIAEGLARRNATVVLLSRDRQRAKEVARRFSARNPNARTEAMEVDLSSQKSIRSFVTHFTKRHERLHVLVNAAGVLMFERRLTEDGIEMTVAVDYLGHFLLTNLLLPLLLQSAPSRVLTVAGSPRVMKKTKVDFDDIQHEQRFRGIETAKQAAVLRVLFTYALARRLQGTGVNANAFHPGLVRTRLLKHAPCWGKMVSAIVRPFLKNSCDTGVYLASSPGLEGVNGKYFVGTAPVSFQPEWADDSTLRKLWRLSCTLTGVGE
jgi:retinol dehydrogenase-14